jgi:hypothetical protein
MIKRAWNNLRGWWWRPPWRMQILHVDVLPWVVGHGLMPVRVVVVGTGRVHVGEQQFWCTAECERVVFVATASHVHVRVWGDHRHVTTRWLEAGPAGPSAPEVVVPHAHVSPMFPSLTVPHPHLPRMPPLRIPAVDPE